MIWTPEILKQYFEAILIEKDKAIQAALAAVKEENRKTEIAAEKRFELLNELRGGVATKEQLEALEKIVDVMKTNQATSQGRGLGLSQSWTILIGVVGFIGGIIAIFYTLSK